MKALRFHFDANRIPHRARIVDIGCGSGFFLNRIRHEVANNDFQLAGVDFSPEAIGEAQSRYGGIRFFCEDGTRTHFGNQTFDAVISYGSYEHFPKPEDGIRELSRILARGGLFFCMMPALGIDRADRDDEGWYEERQVANSPVRQMQWNLKRITWESYFKAAHLNLYPAEDAAQFGALKPGVFFFGEKGADG